MDPYYHREQVKFVCCMAGSSPCEGKIVWRSRSQLCQTYGTGLCERHYHEAELQDHLIEMQVEEENNDE
jgi:hypothetical protein